MQEQAKNSLSFPPHLLSLSLSVAPFDVLFDCHFIYLLNKANLSSNTKAGPPIRGQGVGTKSQRIAIAIPIVNATKKNI